MIDNLWETVEWKEKSRKVRESQSKMSWNHTSRSRSFLARNSMIEELIRVTHEQSQPSITSPMTEEQISVKVLGKRSRYLKGFGIPMKSLSPNSEVLFLREQIAELARRTSFLEGLVLQLAKRAGIDLGIVVGGEGTSGGARDATSL